MFINTKQFPFQFLFNAYTEYAISLQHEWMINRFQYNNVQNVHISCRNLQRLTLYPSNYTAYILYIKFIANFNQNSCWNIHVKSKNVSNLCDNITFFFGLAVPLYFNFFCDGFNFGLGTGNASILEWPPKPSYAASGFTATEEAILVWFGLLNMLNLLLAEGRLWVTLWEPFSGVRPKLHDLMFRYGDCGSDWPYALDSGDSRLPNCKENISIFCETIYTTKSGRQTLLGYDHKLEKQKIWNACCAHGRGA